MKKPAKPKTDAEVRAIYNSFLVKDLSWGEFLRQYRDLTNPKKMMSDLGDIELIKARERSNRIKINSAIHEN